MKPFLLLLMLLISTGAARAQPLPVTRPDSLAAAQAAPDTAAAIHRLFAGKRKRRTIIAGVIIVAATGAAIAYSAGNDHFLNRKEIFKVYGVMAAIGIGIDFLMSDFYSRREEKYAIEAFHTHRLTKRLKRKLRHKHKYFPDVLSDKQHRAYSFRPT